MFYGVPLWSYSVAFEVVLTLSNCNVPIEHWAGIA